MRVTAAWSWLKNEKKITQNRSLETNTTDLRQSRLKAKYVGRVRTTNIYIYIYRVMVLLSYGIVVSGDRYQSVRCELEKCKSSKEYKYKWYIYICIFAKMVQV